MLANSIILLFKPLIPVLFNSLIHSSSSAKFKSILFDVSIFVLPFSNGETLISFEGTASTVKGPETLNLAVSTIG